MAQAAASTDRSADYARFRRRDHANIESLQNLVIAEIARRASERERVEGEDGPDCSMPPNVRHLISALQGSHGGGAVAFEEFERDYLSIGRQLQFRGSDDAIRSRVRAWIQAFDEWQFSVGVQLFVIVPGGDLVRGEGGAVLTHPDGSPVRTKTKFIDYLKPRVDEGVQRARASAEWKRHPGRALEAQVASVVADLPTLGTRAESGAERKPSTPLSVEVYEQRQEERLKATVEKVAHEIELKGGDPFTFVRRLARDLVKMAASLNRTEDARHDLISLDRLARREDAAEEAGATNAYVRESDAAPTNAGEAAEAPAPRKEKPTQATPEVVSEESVSFSDLAENAEPDMLAWALAYARQGLAVFPVHTVFDDVCSCPCNKDCTEDAHKCGSECGSKGKHPVAALAPKGVKNATTDEATIRRWWSKMPAANIGLAMGGPLRLVAMDEDPRNGGSASLADLIEAHGADWLKTFTQETGGLGHHFLYRLPEGVEVVKGNQKNKLAPGIDTKTEGGYVVAAPSIHASGRRYRVAVNEYIAEAPAFLVEFLTAREPRVVIDFQEARGRRVPGATSAGEKFYEGERNDGLFAVGIGRWRHGWAADATELHAQLLDANASRCVPPVEDSEVAKIAAHIAADYAHLKGVDADAKGAA
jgi:hypothetical protein